MFLFFRQKLFKQSVIIVFSALFATGMIFSIRAYTTNAFCTAPWGMLCFGGPITDVAICCNGIKIEVGDPRDGEFLIVKATDINMFFNVYTEDICVKGDAYPGGVCLKPLSWPPCTRTDVVDGIVRQIGDSRDLNKCQVGGG